MWKIIRCRISGSRKNKIIPFMPARSLFSRVSVRDPSNDLTEKTRLSTKYGFIKEMIKGNFDVRIMTYPEVLGEEKLDLLADRIEEIYDCVHHRGNCMGNNDIENNYLKLLKDLDILSLRAPVGYGGAGVTTTEFAKVLEALGALDVSMARTVCNHEAGLQPLIEYGTLRAKNELLGFLVRDKWLAALCTFETSCYMDFNAINTVIMKHNIWTISGQKKDVVNGPLADLFIVTTMSKDPGGQEKDEYCSVFAVRRAYGGVSTGNPKSMLGAQDCAVSDVFFKNTPVPKRNLLATPTSGLQVAFQALVHQRYCVGASALGFLKRLIKLALEFSSNGSLQEIRTKDLNIFPRKIAHITLKTYAAESMVYLTTGLLDRKDQVDCSMETGLLKVFVTDILREAVDSLYELFGRNSFVDGFPFENMLRDVQVLTIPEDGNDFIRITTAILGIFPVDKPDDYDEKASRVDRRMLTKVQTVLNAHGKSLNLHYYVHPTLKEAANQLERCVNYLTHAVQVLREVPQSNVREHEMEFCCFADVLINIYAMISVIGRASRSYCIGLPNANFEIEMANLFCMQASAEVEFQMKLFEEKDPTSTDRKYQHISAKLFEKKGYFLKNPIVPDYRWIFDI